MRIKVFTLVLPVLAPLILLAASPAVHAEDVTEEIVVKGQQLEDALLAGDYHRIGTLERELHRLEAERKSNLRSSSSNESQNNEQDSTNDSESDQDDCGEHEVKKSWCELKAATAHSEQIRTCRYPSLVGLGEQCRAEKEAEHAENMRRFQRDFSHNMEICRRGQ